MSLCIERFDARAIDAASAIERDAFPDSRPAGAFLRDMSVGANQRTLLIGDYDSHQLETIRTTRLS